MVRRTPSKAGRSSRPLGWGAPQVVIKPFPACFYAMVHIFNTTVDSSVEKNHYPGNGYDALGYRAALALARALRVVSTDIECRLEARIQQSSPISTKPFALYIALWIGHKGILADLFDPNESHISVATFFVQTLQDAIECAHMVGAMSITHERLFPRQLHADRVTPLSGGINITLRHTDHEAISVLQHALQAAMNAQRWSSGPVVWAEFESWALAQPAVAWFPETHMMVHPQLAIATRREDLQAAFHTSGLGPLIDLVRL